MNSGRGSRRIVRAWVGICLAASLLPTLALAQASSEPVWVYRIQPGDTLIDLTASYLSDKTSWRELQRLNKVADPLKLPPGGSLRMPIRLLRREASVAQAVFAQGEVNLIRPPNAAVPLQTGAELRSGDLLRTGEQGSLTLRFVDGSRLLLASRSEVTVEQLLVYGRSALPAMQLRLHRGSADSRIQPAPQRPPDYQLKTPSLNLGVRGTEFRVQVAEDGRSAAQVLQGAVAAGALKVEAGHGIVAAVGETQPKQGRLHAAPDLGAIEPRLERLPPTLSWPALPGARAYRAQVYAHNDFERLLLDGRFEQPRAQWSGSADLPDGRYSLRVRAIDELGLEGLAADLPFTLKARPEPPFSRAPAAEATVYGERVELAWTQPVKAERYRLQLAATLDFAAPLRDLADLRDTTYDLTLPPGRYFWRLASIAAGPDPGPFGDAQSFTVKPIPPTPALAPPTIGDKELQFRWAAAPSAARYQLQWASDAEFKQLIALPNEGITEAPELLLARPDAGLYFLRVRSIDASGYAGPYGTAQQVEIPRSRWFWLLPLGLLVFAL